MDDLLQKIALVDTEHIDSVLKAVLQRYAVLFPDWEISTISLHRGPDRNQQLERMIALLQAMRCEKPSPRSE